MSYLLYLKLYTNKKNCNRDRIRRGCKNGYWLKLLKRNDKLDIFDDKFDKCWHVGSIVKIEYDDKNNQRKLLIHYDGWAAKFDEWTTINFSLPQPKTLRKLHTFTPHHDYIHSTTNNTECKWEKSNKWIKCNVCNLKCCAKCYAINISLEDTVQFQCKKCCQIEDYQQLFNAVHSYYSMGIIIPCVSCKNTICFESRFEIEFNVTMNNVYRPSKVKPCSIFQYIPQQIAVNTIIKYGKQRRIFCEECTKNELQECYCRRVMEIPFKQIGMNDTVRCYNHRIYCTVCNQWQQQNEDFMRCEKCTRWCHAECLLDCSICGIVYCQNCMKGRKCNECNTCICNKCNIHSCDQCHADVCEQCKFYHSCFKLKRNKIMNKENVVETVSDKGMKFEKKKECIIDEVEYMNGNQNEWLMDYDFMMDYLYENNQHCMEKKFHQNMNRKRTTKKRKVKQFWKRRRDKICNIKQIRKFNIRYALSLQY